MEHSHTAWGFINQHWMEISMVWFPAFLGYLNATVAAFKVMGWDRLAVELGKIEDALRTFVANVKSQNQTPKTGG